MRSELSEHDKKRESHGENASWILQSLWDLLTFYQTTLDVEKKNSVN